MTLYTPVSGESRTDTPEELLRLRREKIRSRRIKEGARIGGPLTDALSGGIIELYPALKSAL